MTEINFWDDPDVQSAAAGDWFTFTKVGDELEGTLKSLGKKVWPKGDIGIEMHFEGDTPSYTAGAWKLKNALLELKPQPGDRLAIKLIHEDASNTRYWAVGIQRKDGSTQLIEQKP